MLELLFEDNKRCVFDGKKYAPLDAVRGRDDPYLANDGATAYVTIVVLNRHLRILRTISILRTIERAGERL